MKHAAESDIFEGQTKKICYERSKKEVFLDWIQSVDEKLLAKEKDSGWNKNNEVFGQFVDNYDFEAELSFAKLKKRPEQEEANNNVICPPFIMHMIAKQWNLVAYDSTPMLSFLFFVLKLRLKQVDCSHRFPFIRQLLVLSVCYTKLEYNKEMEIVEDCVIQHIRSEYRLMIAILHYDNLNLLSTRYDKGYYTDNHYTQPSGLFTEDFASVFIANARLSEDFKKNANFLELCENAIERVITSWDNCFVDNTDQPDLLPLTESLVIDVNLTYSFPIVYKDSFRSEDPCKKGRSVKESNPRFDQFSEEELKDLNMEKEELKVVFQKWFDDCDPNLSICSYGWGFQPVIKPFIERYTKSCKKYYSEHDNKKLRKDLDLCRNICSIHVLHIIAKEWDRTPAVCYGSYEQSCLFHVLKHYLVKATANPGAFLTRLLDLSYISKNKYKVTKHPSDILARHHKLPLTIFFFENLQFLCQKEKRYTLSAENIKKPESIDEVLNSCLLPIYYEYIQNNTKYQAIVDRIVNNVASLWNEFLERRTKDNNGQIFDFQPVKLEIIPSFTLLLEQKEPPTPLCEIVKESHLFIESIDNRRKKIIRSYFSY